MTDIAAIQARINILELRIGCASDDRDEAEARLSEMWEEKTALEAEIVRLNKERSENPLEEHEVPLMEELKRKGGRVAVARDWWDKDGIRRRAGYEMTIPAEEVRALSKNGLIRPAKNIG